MSAVKPEIQEQKESKEGKERNEGILFLQENERLKRNHWRLAEIQALKSLPCYIDTLNVDLLNFCLVNMEEGGIAPDQTFIGQGPQIVEHPYLIWPCDEFPDQDIFMLTCFYYEFNDHKDFKVDFFTIRFKVDGEKYQIYAEHNQSIMPLEDCQFLTLEELIEAVEKLHFNEFAKKNENENETDKKFHFIVLLKELKANAMTFENYALDRVKASAVKDKNSTPSPIPAVRIAASSAASSPSVPGSSGQKTMARGGKSKSERNLLKQKPPSSQKMAGRLNYKDTVKFYLQFKEPEIQTLMQKLKTMEKTVLAKLSIQKQIDFKSDELIKVVTVRNIVNQRMNLKIEYLFQNADAVSEFEHETSLIGGLQSELVSVAVNADTYKEALNQLTTLTDHMRAEFSFIHKELYNSIFADVAICDNLEKKYEEIKSLLKNLMIVQQSKSDKRAVIEPNPLQQSGHSEPAVSKPKHSTQRKRISRKKAKSKTIGANFRFDLGKDASASEMQDSFIQRLLKIDEFDQKRKESNRLTLASVEDLNKKWVLFERFKQQDPGFASMRKEEGKDNTVRNPASVIPKPHPRTSVSKSQE